MELHSVFHQQILKLNLFPIASIAIDIKEPIEPFLIIYWLGWEEDHQTGGG